MKYLLLFLLLLATVETQAQTRYAQIFTNITHLNVDQILDNGQPPTFTSTNLGVPGAGRIAYSYTYIVMRRTYILIDISQLPPQAINLEWKVKLAEEHKYPLGYDPPSNGFGFRLNFVDANDFSTFTDEQKWGISHPFPSLARVDNPPFRIQPKERTFTWNSHSDGENIFSTGNGNMLVMMYESYDETQSAQIWTELDILEVSVTYELPEVSFTNEFGDDPAHDDFEIDANPQQHGFTDVWFKDAPHVIEALSHDGVNWIDDSNRPYDWDPVSWTKKPDGVISSTHPDGLWEDVSIDRKTDFVASHSRLVDNQFTMWNGTEAAAFSSTTYTADNAAKTSGDIVTKRTSTVTENSSFNVIMPSEVTQNGHTYHLMKWTSDVAGYGDFDANMRTVTQTVTPATHHTEVYNNGYKAEYYRLRLINADSRADITNTRLNASQYTAYIDPLAATPYKTFVNITLPAYYEENGITYTFAGWGDESIPTVYSNGNPYREIQVQKPGVDYANALTAYYKVHMKSTAAAPTKTNSQRKIAIDGQNTYHAVYESSGEVFYIASTDQGQTWSTERRISCGNGGARRPSIATPYVEASMGFYMGHCAIVTYVDELTSKVIVTRVMENAITEKMHEYFVSNPGDCTPAIASTQTQVNPSFVVVWEDGNQLKFSAYIKDEVLPADSNQVLLTSQSGVPRYPNVGWSSEYAPSASPYFSFSFSWIEDGNIKYASIAVDDNARSIASSTWNQTTGITGIELVHDKGFRNPIPAINAPSMTVDNIHPSYRYSGFYGYLAYEIQNTWSGWPTTSKVVSPTLFAAVPKSTSPGSGQIPYASRFVVRQRTTTANSWTTTQMGYSTTAALSFPMSPSIGIEDFQSQSAPRPNLSNVRVLYRHKLNQINMAIPTGIQTVQLHVEGRDPNMTYRAPDNKLKDLFVRTDLAPFTYQLNTSTGIQKTATAEIRNMREIFVQKDGARAFMGISHPRMVDVAGNVQLIDWNTEKDSSGMDYQFPLAQRMRTSTFTATNAATLMFERELYSMDGDDFSQNEAFVLNIYNAANGEIVRTQSVFMRELPKTESTYELTGIDINSLRGMNLYMTFDVAGEINPEHVEVVDFYAMMDDGGLEKEERTAAAPSNIMLEQNYPNPFNPSTSITYGVPADGQVKLAVYDNLGREVQILTNEYKTAGTYAIQFNAGGLPSGLYHYKIETASGSLTKNMLLAK